MKVKELIAELEKIKDEQQEIGINTTNINGQCFNNIVGVSSNDEGTAIEIHLSDYD